MIPEHFIQELLNRVDIVDVIDGYVPLKKAGTNHIACCPFHGEKTPSFTVSAAKQFYHCFGCGAHGTAIGFLMEYQGLSFVDAIEALAQRVGMKVPRVERTTENTARPAPSQYEIMQQASTYYRAQLKQSQQAVAYLKSRGLTGEIAARFQIGYAPQGWQNLREIFPDYDNSGLSTLGLTVKNDEGRVYDRFRNRVMFPIHDQRGQIIGFGGRVMDNADGGPKYLNSPETPLFQKGLELYGLFLARPAIRAAGKVIVVEGYMDVVALAQSGIEYAVATLGTATTSEHIAKLKRQTDHIVFCFDGDAAGRKAAWRAAMNALPTLTDGLLLSFLFLPPEHDPDSYVREFGKAHFEQALKQALPLSAYLMQELAARNDLASQEGRVRFLQDVQPLLQQVQAPKLNFMLRQRVAELAQITPAEVAALLKLSAPEPARQVAAKTPRTAPALMRKLLHLLVQKPALASRLRALEIVGDDAECEAVRQIIALEQATPLLTTPTLLQLAAGRIAPHLLTTLSAAQMAWDDEPFDLELEFSGVLHQLQQSEAKQHVSALLAKPFAALSAEEKALLKDYRKAPGPTKL